MALAATLSGAALAQTVAPLVAQRLIDGYGWRQAFRWMGLGWGVAVLLLILPFFFDALGLHRLQAAFLPHNIASRRVLEKNGFKEEGFAENYLQIDGKWADHVLFALTRERWDARLRVSGR